MGTFNDMKKKIYYFSRFDIDSKNKGGGIRRASQILELLNIFRSDYEIKYFRNTSITSWEDAKKSLYNDKKSNFWEDNF